MATTRSEDPLRWIVVLLAVLVLLPVLSMAVAMPMMGTMGGWGMGTGGRVSPLWWAGSALVSLLVVAAVGYVLYRLLVRGDAVGGRGDRALEELRMAYARGDVSEEEFERRRERLTEPERYDYDYEGDR